MRRHGALPISNRASSLSSSKGLFVFAENALCRINFCQVGQRTCCSAQKTDRDSGLTLCIQQPFHCRSQRFWKVRKSQRVEPYPLDLCSRCTTGHIASLCDLLLPKCSSIVSCTCFAQRAMEKWRSPYCRIPPLWGGARSCFYANDSVGRVLGLRPCA